MWALNGILPQTACGPGNEDSACLMETLKPVTGLPAGIGDRRSRMRAGRRKCSLPSAGQAGLRSPHPEPLGTDEPSPENQRSDPIAATLMTASAVSTTGPVKTKSQLVGSLPEEIADVSGGIPSVLPEAPLRQTSHSFVSPPPPKASVVPEPVAMVSSPNPYAYVPSLYDLYMQAAPRTGRLERFGIDVFRRDPRGKGIPMDLPAGPDYVLGPGDGVTIDLWGGISQRLFRTVDREGRLSLPEAGPLLVSGRTLGEVQEVVQRILRTQYRDVSADISLGRLRSVRVYVVGEVVVAGGL